MYLKFLTAGTSIILSNFTPTFHLLVEILLFLQFLPFLPFFPCFALVLQLLFSFRVSWSCHLYFIFFVCCISYRVYRFNIDNVITEIRLLALLQHGLCFQVARHEYFHVVIRTKEWINPSAQRKPWSFNLQNFTKPLIVLSWFGLCIKHLWLCKLPLVNIQTKRLLIYFTCKMRLKVWVFCV